MVPAKKHPLEVFRKHGPFSSGSKSAKRSGSTKKSGEGLLTGLKKTFESSSKDSARKSSVGKSPARKSSNAKNGIVSSQKRTRRKSAPGDQRFTLSLNGVLFIAVVIVGLSITAYFFGYQKGQKESLQNPENMALQQSRENNAPGGDIGEYRTQDTSNNPLTNNSTQDGSLHYGVQVGTWDVSKSYIAKEANTWLRKNGYNSRLYPFANGKKLIIIVGSFRSKQDQELNTLLERIRSIDNYPYGASSPFKDARIKPFSVKGAGG